MFFFFKQKTSYEMRISDWSSDVCSSDLNWVAQWGDPTEKKPLAAAIVARPAAEYEIAAFAPAQRMSKADAYSTASGITADGWPIATDGKAAWLTHCYGMVGVARDVSPDTGTGAELFTPIGQSARRLDRNCTENGRAHVCTPVTNAQLVCRLLLENT